MSGGTISTSTNKVEAFKLQSSAQGVTIPWVRGVNRVAGNLVWYNGFKAVGKTESSGGKGGTEVRSTTWSYQADAIMAICSGPILDIPRIWKGKSVYDGGISAGVIKKATEVYPVPLSGPMVYTVAEAATYRNIVTVTSTGDPGGDGYWSTPLAQGYDYLMTSAGQLTVLNEQYRGFDIAISYQYINGSESRSALQELGLSLGRGAMGQAVWSGLSSYPSNEQIGYSGLAYVAGQAYQLTDQASLENHVFEVVAPLAYHLDASTPDVDISIAIRELMLDSRSGAGFPSANSASWAAWSDFCVAAGILGSPVLTEQIPMVDVLREVAEATITAPVWSDGLLKMVPFGDSEETGRGRTYTPNVEPVYDLDNDTFWVEGESAPLRYVNTTPTERYNHFRIEYRDRANGYSPAIAEARDLADIEERGLRSHDIIKMDWVCDGAVARKIAQLKLQKSLSVRTKFECDLPWHFVLLECADLVTVTQGRLGLDRFPVRIEVIEENEDGDLTLTLEEYPIGSASAAEYDHEYPDGYIPDYNVKPGSVEDPVFFEAPVDRTTTGLEVWIAATGKNPNWGGANVWVSVDGSGTNYKIVGTIDRNARYGTLRSAVTPGSTTIQVELNTDAELLSGGALDSETLQTLIYMGGATPEYAAYEVATLVGADQYDLSGVLTRGAYSTGAVNHALGDPFVRVDDGIVTSGPLDLSFIGKEIWVKFTSFNVFRGAEESLADVAEYRYLVTGYMAKLPPSQPTGGDYTVEEFGVRLICAKNPEPDVVAYEWRAGATLAGSVALDQAGGTSYPWRVQIAGPFTAWVAAVDRFGNYSTYAQINGTVAGATITGLTSSFIGQDFALDYSVLPGAFAVASVEIRYGDVFASATVVSGATLNNFRRKADWAGIRKWWVVAYDVAGNRGTEVSIEVGITIPGGVVGPRAEVVDNNVLVYWSKPVIGTLPIARYDIKKGATYAGAVLIGSNADSTFTVVFEQLGGTYTYWLVPYDTAGNQGPPVSLVATVSQPPDYILRVDWASDFSGTKTNMFLDGGSLIGPVNTTETWAQHYTTNGFATPQDQISAGLPLYIEPSLATGSYVEVFDYGAVLPATTINVTTGYELVDGSVTVSCQIQYRETTGDPWTSAPAGTQVLATNFRYVRVTLTFTCTAGANIIKMNAMNVKLSVKVRNDKGEGEVTNAATGVVVNFNYPFIDADTPRVQPGGLVPLIPVVDYLDVPNPTSFTVYLYTLAGVKTTGQFSWTAGGY
jgi:hypothetical protein